MLPSEPAFDELDPRTPVVEAACTIVGARLAPLPGLLRASTADAIDVECVHRLRVATRRADAALVTFRPCFGRKRWARLRRDLKRIRRTASEARSCDVDLERLEQLREQAEEGGRAAIEAAMTATRAERETAQGRIRRVAGDLGAGKLEHRVSKLLATLRRPRGMRSLLDAASRRLPKLVERLERAAAEDPAVLDNLHELRLHVKRLRYGLEVLAPCVESPPAEELRQTVRALQNRLGKINDAHELAARLDRLAEQATARGEPTLAAGFGVMAASCRADRERRRRTFVKWWKQFRDDGTLARLVVELPRAA